MVSEADIFRNVNDLPKRDEKFWNRKMETIDRKELRELQFKLAKRQLKHAYENAPYYHDRFKEAGIKPDDIKDWNDWEKKVPITLKDDLRDYREKTGDPFYGVLALPFERVRDTYISTGTTGRSTYWAFSKEDWKWVHEVTMRCVWSMYKLRPGDMFLANAGRFHGGFEVMRGPDNLLDIGVTILWNDVLPLPMFLDKMIQYLEDFKGKIKAMYFPAFLAWAFMGYMKSKELDPIEDLGLDNVIGGWAGAALTTPTRDMLKETFGFRAVLNMSVLGDTMVPLIGCLDGGGAKTHVWEDIHLIEHVDMKTGEPIEPDEVGDWVITPLHNRAVPHIRWRMEDYTKMDYEPCVCGTTHLSITILGRESDRITVKGKIILPQMVEEALYEIPEIGPGGAMACQVVRTHPESQDDLIIRTGYLQEKVTDKEALKRKVKEKVEEKLNIPIRDVELLTPEEVAQAGSVGWKIARIQKRY
ncbi:MAG: phenylacetate--CoA ligase family protein [Candidatus Freyarchaeota archaeon]